MKKSFFIGLFISLLILNGCGEEEETAGDSGLTVSVSGTALLFPTDGRGCLGADNVYETVTKAYFTVPGISMSWSKFDYNLLIAYVKIEVTGSGLSSNYSIALDSDDIGKKIVYIVDDVPADIVNGIVLGPTGTPELVVPRLMQAKESCSLKFGGVSIADENKSFSLDATITVQGVAIGSRVTVGDVAGNFGEELPVKAKAKFKIKYED